MTRLLLRGAFVAMAALAAGSQAARIRADAREPPAPGLEDRLAELGLSTAGSPDPDLAAATAPGCEAPVLLARLHFDGLGRSASRTLTERRSATRFVYLGLVSAQLDRPAVAGRWALAGALRAAGLRERDVPRDVVVVSLPAECPSLADLEWSRLSPWR